MQEEYGVGVMRSMKIFKKDTKHFTGLENKAWNNFLSLL